MCRSGSYFRIMLLNPTSYPLSLLFLSLKKIVFVFLNHAPETYLIVTIVIVQPGLHNLCHPTIRDGSTWSQFGACGEHGDVFLFSNLGAL